MTPLVLFDSLYLSKASNKNFYTTTEIIAEQTGISYDSVSRLVRKYKKKLEEIAPLMWHFESSMKKGSRGFEIRVNKRGNARKVYHLNEQQTLFFIPLLGNAPAVVQFKFDLAAAFIAMRNELQARRIERATEKVTTRSLTDAVQAWEKKSQHSYIHIRNMLVKLATGEPHTHVKNRDPSNKTTMVDLLTSDELDEYNYMKSLVIPMLSKSGAKAMDYHDIKEKLEFLTTKKAGHLPR